MALVSMRDVTIAFGGEALLDGASLQVEENERIALIGRNGTGKSTLLRIVAGEIETDAGVLEFSKGLRVAALPQVVPTDIVGTTYDVIAGKLDAGDHDVQRQIETVISRLAIDAHLRFEELSGGQKRRVLLARALVSQPDLLLLDEPTNHLDIESIEWLEGFLGKFKGTILFVSHDRAFLKKLATRIVDLDRGTLTSWPGDYEKYLGGKGQNLEIEQTQNAKFDKLLASEEVWIRQGIQARRTRNEGRVRALMKLRDESRKRRELERRPDFSVQEAERSGRRVIQAKDVEFSYDGVTSLVNGLTVNVVRGEKIGVIGPNGSGKSTLLKLLLGQLQPVAGEIEHGTKLEVAYLDQLREQIDDSKSVADNVADGNDMVTVGGNKKHIIGYLKDFLFPAERAKSPASVLSGGERNRLLLAKLFTKPCNVLVLDEPTNDLDIETLELIEDLLLDFSGTVLLVSHDRAFLNAVATSTLVFEGDGRVGSYAGGYDDWLVQRQEADAAAIRPEKKEKAPRTKKSSDKPRRLSFNEKFELEALPEKIDALETEQVELQSVLADPSFYRDQGDQVAEKTERLEAVEGELAVFYTRWEELEEIKTNSSG